MLLQQKIQKFFRKTRESHIKPGSYRLQKLFGDEYFHVLSCAPIVLVGGTNGKGTTCAFLESIFRHSGFKTGLYTSPHLVSATERIRIAGTPVPEKEILDTIHKLDTNRRLFLPDATFFEHMTAAAFLLFYEKQVDVVICEVGLGGCYDSTNVINPTISVLTGVSLDHTHILGSNVTKIAQDKAYIARRNKPFVLNTQMSKTALNAVIKKANMIGCHMILTSEKLQPNLEQIFAEHTNHTAKTNLRTALTVIDYVSKHLFLFQKRFQINTSSIRKGIQNTFWPGRFDVRQINGKSIIFDCAHNPNGVEFFLRQYKQSKFSGQKYNLFFSSLKDKDWKTNLSLLVRLAKKIHIVPFANERLQNVNDIFLYLKTKFPKSNANIDVNLKSKNLIQEAVNDTSNNTPLLVIGSIAFVGAVFESLNIDVFPS